MASKPYLRKGQGKYAKIDYPTLRRAGVYQPPPDSPARREQRSTGERHPQRGSSSASSAGLPTGLQPPAAAAAAAAITIPPLRLPSSSASPPASPPRRFLFPSTASGATAAAAAAPQETRIMGQRSPDAYSEDSSVFLPAGAETQFGSSADSRLRSDEGLGRDELRVSPPPLGSGRPRTAATVDSGFPRDEAFLSPNSSSGSTNASSLRSMVMDQTALPEQPLQHRERILMDDDRFRLDQSPRSPRRFSPVSAAAAAGTPPSPTREHAAAVAAAARPVASARTTRPADRSTVGNTTEEFERRERQLVIGRDDRQSPNSTATSTSTFTQARNREIRELCRVLNEDKGEEPFFRQRIYPLQYQQQRGAAAAAAAAAPPAHSRHTGGELLTGLERPPQQRMMSARLDSPVSENASIPSPIERVGGGGAGGGRPVLMGGELDSLHQDEVGSLRPPSSSHFRIAGTSLEEEEAERERERREREGRRIRNNEDRRDAAAQYPSMGGRGSSAASDDASSSGSTAAARRYLLGDRRPLHEVYGSDRRRSGEQITRTQQRPSQTRASQATLRRPASFDSDEEPTIDLGGAARREERVVDRRGEQREERRGVEMGLERVRQMECQLRDAIAHADLAEAAIRHTKQELCRGFERKALQLAAAYRERERKLEKEEKKRTEETKAELARVEEMKSQLEKERKLVRKDETMKVKEWRGKYEEENAAHTELKKKMSREQTTRRLAEGKMRKDMEELRTSNAALQTENGRMRRIIEGQQRERASSRGVNAHRAALTRAENESVTAGPRRNGQVKRWTGAGGGGGRGEDKENDVNWDAAAAAAAGQMQPGGGGILKNVRFADTTFTVQPPDATYYEVGRGIGSWGPYATYANDIGNRVIAWRRGCGCHVFQYKNGDLRHVAAYKGITFHSFAGCGSMQIDFVQDRCQVRYYVDGTLEIFRTGREITLCSPNGERRETIKREDGHMHAEIWDRHSLKVAVGGEPIRNYGNQYRTRAEVTRRLSGAYVALHSNHDLEFMEPNFTIMYHGQSKIVKLVINVTPTSEIQYIMRPSDSGQIIHVTENERRERIKTDCVQCGVEARTRDLRDGRAV